MVTRDVWIPECSVCISNFTALYTQKIPESRCVTAHLMVTSNSLLTEPLWSGCSSDSLQGYKFHGCLREKEIAALGLLVCESQCCHPPCLLQSVSLKLPLVATARSSTVNMGQRCDCMRQWTREQLNSGWDDRPRRQTVRDSKIGAGNRPSRTRDFPRVPSRPSILQGQAITRFASFAAWNVL